VPLSQSWDKFGYQAKFNAKFHTFNSTPMNLTWITWPWPWPSQPTASILRIILSHERPYLCQLQLREKWLLNRFLCMRSKPPAPNTLTNAKQSAIRWIWGGWYCIVGVMELNAWNLGEPGRFLLDCSEMPDLNFEFRGLCSSSLLWTDQDLSGEIYWVKIYLLKILMSTMSYWRPYDQASWIAHSHVSTSYRWSVYFPKFFFFCFNY